MQHQFTISQKNHLVETPKAMDSTFLTRPVAKINLGLNIVSKRSDGYHNLETVFYPLPICDVLELSTMHPDFPSSYHCDLKVTGVDIEGDEQRNLVVRAYNKVSERYALPRLHAHLFKSIPTQAGMGGGSSDCAFMIRALNEWLQLQMSEEEMISMAASLGADCPFFITCKPSYAEGIGEQLHPIELNLGGWDILVVKPDIPVSTKEAFALITPHQPSHNCADIVMQPVETWRNLLVNDFESSIFPQHPRLAEIKQQLYDTGAVYAAMSGSGSSLFGLFHRGTIPTDFTHQFKDCYTAAIAL